MKLAFRETNKKNTVVLQKTYLRKIKLGKVKLYCHQMCWAEKICQQWKTIREKSSSQISHKSEEYCHDTTEKNSSNKIPRNADKLGKNSKKNFIGKFCEPCFNNTDQQHLLKSIHHGEICTSGNRETKNNGIILGGNKSKLTFNETSRKQHNSGRANTFEKDQVEQSPIMSPLDVLKGKNMMPAEKNIQRKISFIHKEAIKLKRTIAMITPVKSVENNTTVVKNKNSREIKLSKAKLFYHQICWKGKTVIPALKSSWRKNKFNSWINIKSEEYSNDSSEKCSYNKKETAKIEFHSSANVENRCDCKLGKNKESSAEKVLEPSHPSITVKGIQCKAYVKKKIF